MALGSIYFYYRSKGALAQAVIERRGRLIEARFAVWQSLPCPRTRLEALVDVWPKHKRRLPAAFVLTAAMLRS